MRTGAMDSALATRHGLGDAVVAPLKDFGLMKAEVPAVLQEASDDPYKLPERTDCAWLGYEVARIDLAMGPDVDVPRDAGKQTLAGRGSRAASDAALDAVRDLTTGWIPFRSTVRRLTGAAGNQDEVEDAAHAGGLRRAYLKGLGLQMGCAHPAAPMSAPMMRTIIASREAEAQLKVQAAAAAVGRSESRVAVSESASAAEPAEVFRTGQPASSAVPVQATPISSSSTAALVPGV